jgi:hypothetical protein
MVERKKIMISILNQRYSFLCNMDATETSGFVAIKNDEIDNNQNFEINYVNPYIKSCEKTIQSFNFDYKLSIYVKKVKNITDLVVDTKTQSNDFVFSFNVKPENVKNINFLFITTLYLFKF